MRLACSEVPSLASDGVVSAEANPSPIRWRLQVGAVLVSQDNIILGIGYNGFPRGCPDADLPWAKCSHDGDILTTKCALAPCALSTFFSGTDEILHECV